VYVEEVSFRAKSIEGVSTSTTAFVGPTRKGPIGDTPELITSLGDFQRVYGGLENLTTGLNFVAHAVRNYFDNGGARLYVSRAFLPASNTDAGRAASGLVVSGGGAADQARFVARFPGGAGNGRLLLRQVDTPATVRTMERAVEGTLLRVRGATATFFVKRGATWVDSGGTALNLTGLGPGDAPGDGADVLTLSILAADADGNEQTFDDLGFDRGHPRWIGHVLAATPPRRIDALENLYALEVGDSVTAFALRGGLFTGDAEEATVALTGGNDGAAPTQAAYEAALEPIAALEDVSIVAAPGHSALADFAGIQGALISHAERRRAYRIAVLDTPAAETVAEARAVRSRIDSTRAALYYPWVVVSNPLARPGDDSIPREITLPPSGFVCGIYARTDVDRGVFKAPANEIVRGALRFESDVTFAQQEVLNPIGVNCLRYLSGRGYRLWGARTASSDPEWKYVNVRRYFNYLESSIDRSTQWAVFEPNGELLWANIRETVESFLYGEWRSGALLGTSPKEAFFVRCDRSTMTQSDLDNGRLVCLIGVAVVKPAEFVIFRIGQKTADARN
jgi:phage tail sheath protein FI